MAGGLNPLESCRTSHANEIAVCKPIDDALNVSFALGFAVHCKKSHVPPIVHQRGGEEGLVRAKDCSAAPLITLALRVMLIRIRGVFPVNVRFDGIDLDC